jgi:hypothetical protein
MDPNAQPARTRGAAAVVMPDLHPIDKPEIAPWSSI